VMSESAYAVRSLPTLFKCWSQYGGSGGSATFSYGQHD
jgi:hypothetical protein